MIKIAKWALLTIILLGLAFFLSPQLRKKAQLKALDKIGDAATKQISSNPDAAGTVAADFINIPIQARQIGPDVWQATGVGNTHLIKTKDGHVLFDTGLSTQVTKHIEALKPHMDGNKVSHIVLSHSHSDHSGGTKAWHENGMEIVTHVEFGEEQRYLTELQPYQWKRNRTLFPWMPETPPKFGLIAYGGIKPTITVANGQPLKFTHGGRNIEIHALPGAEGSDNLVLWLPEDRILFSGDFFGPIFPQFPNIFTMRGEKIRKPYEYAQSLKTIIELDPLVIVPSHRNPITDKTVIDDGLRRMHGATIYVHDAVIEGMNSGKSVEELMADITLPAELELSQEHGKVSWAVKSIWEYYMTWFHFDKTTELYHVPIEQVYADIIDASGKAPLNEKAQAYLDVQAPLKALHLTDIVLGADPLDKSALQIRIEALENLLNQAKNTTNNSYEIYWLDSRLKGTQGRLQPSD